MIVWLSMKMLSTLTCLVWGVSEIIMSWALRSRGADTRREDRFSLPLLWLVIAASVLAGVYLGSHGIGFVRVGCSIISTFGLALILTGLVVRWAAILTLRRYFTTDVSIRDGHQLVRRGIYKIVRHPAYSGMMLSFAGLGLTFSNWLSTGVIVLPILGALLYRIRVEERALTEYFGNDYVTYCKGTSRLLPLIY